MPAACHMHDFEDMHKLQLQMMGTMSFIQCETLYTMQMHWRWLQATKSRNTITQSGAPPLVGCIPACWTTRAADLMNVLMHAEGCSDSG